jgi:glycosyltransferase involved in cell wall biosynthesis
LSEGFGLAGIEAMAAGLPVILTETGVGSDVVRSGVNGVIVNKRDTKGLAEAMIRLARAPEESCRMGAAAREAARNYTWERVGARTLAIYESAMPKLGGAFSDAKFIADKRAVSVLANTK